MPGAWPLVGRQEELEFIERVLDDHHAAGAVVAGRAGVGKTRLVAEAADRARRAGWVVLRATAATIVAAEAFDGTVQTVCVATGENFPDALTGSAAAAVDGAPVLVVGPDHVPDPTAERLRRLAGT